MAKVDVMTMNGEQKQCFNLNYGVGLSSGNSLRVVNDRCDVMLIQAMFRFLKKYNSISNFSRAIQFSDLPMVNGTFDNLTASMILTYQKTNARELLKVDGIIEPALYSHRNIVMTYGNMRLLTITKLDMECRMAVMSLTNNLADGIHIKVIKHEFPQIAFC